MMLEACSNCKFFIVGDWLQACRRYPKMIDKKPNDWCGEYQKLERIEVPEPPPAPKKGRPRKNV